MSSEVQACGPWQNNAQLIRDGVVPLGYLASWMKVLDPTYGQGRFWTLWRPERLITCDIDPSKSPIGYALDFTAMPFDDSIFDAVVFDPPYKLNGTGGSVTSDEAYGVADRTSWQDRHSLIKLGIAECQRVCAPSGYVLVKCMDQVCSGHVRWQTDEFSAHAQSLGLRKVDRFDLLSSRPQPPGRRQIHARRNYSTLLVFKK